MLQTWVSLPVAARTTMAQLLVCLLRGASDLTAVSASHAKLLKLGASSSAAASNHLLSAYCRSGFPALAHRLLDGMPEPDVISWTTVMSGHTSAGRPDIAMALFRAMGRSGVSPNAFTFSTAVSACAHLANVCLGRQVQGRAEVAGYADDPVVATALIGMYGKAGSIVDARVVFDRMTGAARNVVTWGSMLSVYAQNALGHEAVALFAEFQQEGDGFAPNHFMLSSAVNACASVGRLGIGRCVHGAVLRLGHEGNDVIAAALIDMYSKCGCYEYSRKVFDGIVRPSLIPYTSIIVAAAKYGLGKCVITLFNEMVARGVRPNSVTLLGVMHACSHSGLVDAGLEFLGSMRSEYGIKPSASHYTCAVDMLGRAGRLEEAFELAKEVAAEGGDALMLWSSLLSACRTHKCIDLAVQAGKRVSEFNEDVAGALVTMSNAYVSAGQMDSAADVRSEMRRRGIQKEPGRSWVEIKDVVYVFYAGTASAAGAMATEVMELLEGLEGELRKKGYKRIGSSRVFDVDEEEEGKETMFGAHSEMLALGFALLMIPKGMTIRVMKNLRMCRDCHEAFKLISGIVEREFVVRDLNRFHHFKLGSCSCKNYW